MAQRQQQQRLLQAQQVPKTGVITSTGVIASTAAASAVTTASVSMTTTVTSATPVMSLPNNTKVLKMQPVRPNGVRTPFQAIEISIVSSLIIIFSIH